MVSATHTLSRLSIDDPKLIETFKKLSSQAKRAFVETLTEEEALVILYTWELWARDKQLAPPGDWLVWMILAGRGFGKTRSGAEHVRRMVEAGKWGRVALIAPTASDARDIMIEGESGLLTISPPWFKPLYEPSKRRLTWPNGATAVAYSSEDPERLRGPQFHGGWVDELAAHTYPDETWDMFMFGLRLGENPQAVITTTPKPINLIKQLIQEESTVITKGSTFENRANLAKSFFRHIQDRYEGTRLGEQELYAEILEDMPGALWTRQIITSSYIETLPRLDSIVVAIDPALTQGKRADETGIIVAGKDVDNNFYVIADESCRESPETWARKAIKAYHKYDADRIIAETNMGGDLVETLIHGVDPDVPYRKVHARKNKQTRAEPAAALYEKGKAFHLRPFSRLEDQMCNFVPGETKKSPDRLDAMVLAAHDLLLKKYRKFRTL